MAVKKHHFLKVFMLVIAVGGLTALLLLTENGYLNDLFKKVGVYPVPDAYTALFFVNAGALSTDHGNEDASDNFTFGIYNHEGKDQNYSFLVDIQTTTTTISILSDSLFVKSGETAYRQISYQDVKHRADTGIVTVALPFHNKSIDFKIK